MDKENKKEAHSEVLLDPGNIIEFIKHFMNIILKNLSTETKVIIHKSRGGLSLVEQDTIEYVS